MILIAIFTSPKVGKGKTAPILIKVLTFMQKQAILNTEIELRMV